MKKNLIIRNTAKKVEWKNVSMKADECNVATSIILEKMEIITMWTVSYNTARKI